VPLAGEVPVIGDVVVVEDHVGGDVGQHPPDRWQRAPCLVEVGQLGGVPVALPGRRAAATPVGGTRLGAVGQALRPVRLVPGDQVRGGELAEAEQVVGGLTGGEPQLPAELLTAVGRQAVECRDTGNRGAVARTQQLGAEPGEVADQGAGDLVAVDLVAGQHQRARPAFEVTGALGQQFVRGQQGVLPVAVQQPARAVQQVQRRRPGG